MVAAAGDMFGDDRDTLDFCTGAGPGRPGQVIRLHPQTGQRHLDWLTWGLMPQAWADSVDAPRPIHARAETVIEHPMFAAAFRERRAIVPAGEYYQRRTIGEALGQHYAISRRDGHPLALAGLWEAFRRTDGEVIRTYCIVSVAAAGEVAAIHDRMPLVLDEQDWPQWLGETPGDPAALLRPSAAVVLVVRRVQKARPTRPSAH